MLDKLKKSMKIAIIGGGKRCRAFLQMIDARRFPHLRAEIVAVADPNPKAEGIRLAREKGIYTSKNYRDFYNIHDLDLVIELTGNEELLEDFLHNHPAKVRVLDAAISRLFGDIIRFGNEYLCREHQYEVMEGIIDSMFLSIRDWVLLLRPDFRIVDANEAFLEAMGLPKEAVVGKLCHEIAHRLPHPCGNEEFHCPLKASMETGGGSHAIHEHFDKDQARYCEITTVPLKDEDGDVELVLEIVRDITDELSERFDRKTRAIKQDLARLVHEDKMIALGKLVASAVHEINNPLAGIHALARLMRKEMEEGEPGEEKLETFKYYLHLIDTESARCSTIVNDLLSFARQKRVERKPFQVNDLVEKTIRLSGHRMNLQRIRARLELAESLPQIWGDPDQVQQCLWNLVFNAIEAMPDGGEITVSTRWDEDARQVRLEVSDQGMGIPQEMISRIFEPFFSTKSRDKGVGLGLSVVYGIVKEHGGTIYVRSEVGRGSHFIIRFPA